MGILEDVFVAAFNGEAFPPIPRWVQWRHVSEGLSHCEICLNLDRRWFADDLKPMLPQHPDCHCMVEPLPYERVMKEAAAECRYSKFDPYLFDPEETYKHKKGDMFKDWGYSIKDSEWLRKEIERQGLEKYIAGQYALGELSKDGQRINIRVKLPRKDKEGTVSFKTGWMVYPHGVIKLVTPYGGK